MTREQIYRCGVDPSDGRISHAFLRVLGYVYSLPTKKTGRLRLLVAKQRLLRVLQWKGPHRVGPDVFFQFRFATVAANETHISDEPAPVLLYRFDLRGVVRLIADQRYQPAGFAAPLGEKDMRLTLAAAETLRVPMPLASLVHDRLQTLIARGGEQLDWSGIGQLAARDAGLR